MAQVGCAAHLAMTRGRLDVPGDGWCLHFFLFVFPPWNFPPRQPLPLAALHLQLTPANSLLLASSPLRNLSLPLFTLLWTLPTPFPIPSVCTRYSHSAVTPFHSYPRAEGELPTNTTLNLESNTKGSPSPHGTTPPALLPL